MGKEVQENLVVFISLSCVLPFFHLYIAISMLSLGLLSAIQSGISLCYRYVQGLGQWTASLQFEHQYAIAIQLYSKTVT